MRPETLAIGEKIVGYKDFVVEYDNVDKDAAKTLVLLIENAYKENFCPQL